tara:strand:+ start:582 stop:821 length:240 start_codon:yes stop_codon:yes gene_type:complete
MGFARKLRRRQLVAARKQFFKDFKQKMQEFKMMVACSSCGRQPNEGENIDNWKINQQSENIDLLCLDCFGDEEDWQDET